jgi:hypothetical protein
MSDPLGQVPPAAGRAAALPGVAAPQLVELAQAPPAALPQAATLAASIIGPGGNGVLLLRTDFGTLALKTALALPAGTQLDLRLVTGPPPAVLLLNIVEPASRLPSSPSATAPPAEAPPDAIDLGTQLTATVSMPAGGDASSAALPAGSRLVLRIVPLSDVPTDPAILTGSVIADGAGATVLQTALGTLTLDRRLALPPGTMLGLERLATLPPDRPDAAPAAGQNWPALAEALAALDRIAPDFAARLRSDLAPQSGAQLAGTLLFLLGALGTGNWPGTKAGSVLDRAGRGDLRLRLDSEMDEVRRLADPPSGDWHVFVLPLLDGAALRAVQLYLRRNSGGNTRPEDGTRFVLDVEMSRLGALQLDGLVRHKRLDVMLRSHREIAPALRQEIAAVFRDTTSAAGFAGEIVFATAARFAVAPLDALRPPIAIEA